MLVRNFVLIAHVIVNILKLLEMDSVTMRLTTYFATLMALTVAPILAAHAMVSFEIKVSNSYKYLFG